MRLWVHLGKGTQCRQQGSSYTNRGPRKASNMFKAALTPAWDNRANDRAMPGSSELCRLAPAGHPVLGSCSRTTQQTPTPPTHTHTHTYKHQSPGYRESYGETTAARLGKQTRSKAWCVHLLS